MKNLRGGLAFSFRLLAHSVGMVLDRLLGGKLQYHRIWPAVSNLGRRFVKGIGLDGES